ncbi:hypothetical protein QUF90_11640 [Desulfococcaceae bacterium HSG9]|nr:hypothetical protein [Desulfococcaceae bacterium HSG9]
MNADKPLHALLGIIMVITGLVCHASDAPPRGPYYLILTFFGVYWAVIPGHILFLSEPLIRKIAFPCALPFRVLRYYTKTPVHLKNGSVIDKYSWKVQAYHAKKDHIFIVAGPKPLPLSLSNSLMPFAYEEYRHPSVIERTIELLKTHDIPEVLLDLPRVEKSLRNIITDSCLEDCHGVYDRTGSSYNLNSADDYFHQIELYFRRLEQPDERVIEKFLNKNRIDICTLKVWSRFIKKDPFWTEPLTEMDKILYKWWY